MSEYIPPQYRIIVDDSMTPMLNSIEYSIVESRRIGLYFKLDKHVFLYEYLDIDKSMYTKEDVRNNVRLIDTVDDLDDDERIMDVNSNQFKLVEIIEIDGKVVLSQLWVIDTVDVASWVVRGLEEVFMKVQEYWVINRVCIEEADHFLDEE
jgi:hypothetical protein